MERIGITGVGSRLQGVGRLADGRAAFVPGAIPGEVVEVNIIREKGRFCEASLCAVLEASPDRVSPACPHAGRCGGCQARHIRYERTLELKRQLVFDALTRVGGVETPNVFPTLGCAEPDRTRNKAEYPVALRDGRVVAGACAEGSREVIPLEDCLLQRKESVRALRAVVGHLNALPFARHVRGIVTRVNRARELMLVLCADAPILPDVRRLSPALFAELPELRSLYLCQLDRRPAHALDGRCTLVDGAPVLTDTLLGLTFELAPQAFFQVNPPQAEALYEKALEAAGIAPGCGMNVLDAYCGAGTITLSAASRGARSVTGIEIVPPAIENARRNAALNALSDGTRFICGDAAREIPKLLARGERFDAAILDPPRKGCDDALLNALIAAKLPRIAYVSCNPATLARDVKTLATGGYRLEWAQPVDMFPYTHHVESVVKLTRAGS
ncbi:MAG: 23S rRNA (uracil(1939)-C(5))-methyltransferase RlmD [Clostridia bacterium]|nr:23S rRNA (uracil(1939)-C(5))-methyltransferase RlmD [Clostridia bacterium]